MRFEFASHGQLPPHGARHTCSHPRGVQCVRWIGHPGPIQLIGREVRREVVDQSGHNLGAGFEAGDLGKLVGSVVGLTRRNKNKHTGRGSQQQRR